MTEENTRRETAIDRLANDWVAKLADRYPGLATYIGFPGKLDQYEDYSPAGHDEAATEARAVLAELQNLEPADFVDEVTKKDLSGDLELSLANYDYGLHYRDLNVLASPAQDIRQVYDLMPTSNEADWSIIAKKLSRVAQALGEYRETLEQGISRGITPARRQVDEVAKQVAEYAQPEGFFSQFIANAGEDIPASLRKDLAENARQAAEAYGEFGNFLQNTLHASAGQKDAVGREHYQLASRYFLGATIDLDETYEWGIEELSRMVAEQEAIAREIKPGATVAEAIEHLSQDPSRKLTSTEALQKWMQETSDRAIAELAESHFEIAEPIKNLECLIAPTQEGVIYYTGPTDDFSRPGRMWWSVPKGITEFDTWRELTTVYHEGVPGHHLQIAQAVYNRAELNSWRRLLAGSSGHAEGWALYAERLMADLGYLDDPADRLGMLDGQRMRAARVVLDIGVHLEKPNLEGTGTWNAEYALDFFRQHVNMNDEFIKFEVNRYLGWPGQAPSYKVGQRIWEQIRAEYEQRQGGDFDMKEFHKKSLNLGGVGLDTLRFALLG